MMQKNHPHHELHDISDLDPDGLPSSRSLWKATGVAAVVAAALLTFAILPAEYGVDPTGVGARLGLTALNSTGEAPGATGRSGPVEKYDQPYKTQSVSVSLQPHQGAEIKAIMEARQSYVFEWEAEGGPVYVDMHGQPPDADEHTFTSYWIEESQAKASGNFIAPFKGSHGWYWENKSDQTVTIKLKVTGFFDTLYMP
ncbi:hypothetical protein [Denitromonas sp.]|uniref:hypothetical protein n=1 Tax=Denitromonas sp. TaxID=2734609 RepID=UPI002AFE4D7A|nr:hypothetical protein [Denitromonas sp.]